METNSFLDELKNKFDYSDELMGFLQKAIPALIAYYGEDKTNLIYNSLRDCEIHIQKEGEDPQSFLNNYFGVDRAWDIPFLGGAFNHRELYVEDGKVKSKSIFYLKTEMMHKYTPFDLAEDAKQSLLIHEMCHNVKAQGKLHVEGGHLVAGTGLIKDYYKYDPVTNAITEDYSENTGLEEALNSHDEAAVMTIMTGEKHEVGAYKGMSFIASGLMSHADLASAIKESQFSLSDEWIDFLGKENSDFLIKNFEDWISVLYSSPSEMYRNRKALMEKMTTARENLYSFVQNYSSPLDIESFQNSKSVADKKTMELIDQVIVYNSQLQAFEEENTSARVA